MADAHPSTRLRYVEALSGWKSPGDSVQWRKITKDWLLQNLEMGHVEAGERMFKYLKAGGKLDEVREVREGYRDRHEFHYDLRIEIQGKIVYFETRLVQESRLQPAEIHVVSVHWR